MRIVAVALLGLAGLAGLVPSAARADDAAAEALLEEARERFRDPDPRPALDLVEQALAAGPENPVLQAELHLLKGSLLHLRLDDVAGAWSAYDDVLAVAGDPDADARELRLLASDAHVRKAAIAEHRDGDRRAALGHTLRAHEAIPRATTADAAALLCYRLGRDPATEPAEATALLERARTLAGEALELLPFQFGRGLEGRRWRARFLLARALTEHALGDVAAARETFASIEQRLLDVPSLYRLALYRAREGDPTAARRVLQQALDARPTAGARNALRQRIREEPDFAALRDREAWRALLREEPQSS